MATLSRTKKYQQLRDQLDEGTTIAQSQQLESGTPSRPANSSNSLPHAAKALFPHEEVTSQPASANEIPASPVMDELLGEVRQYNIENGNRVAMDTQFNILKTLDDPEAEVVRRKAHVLPMEIEEEEIGTTMELPQNTNPVPSRAAQAPEGSAIARLRTPKEDQIQLTHQPILIEDEEEDDELDLFQTGSFDNLDATIEQEVLPSAAKKKKKKKLKKAKVRNPVPVKEEPETDVEMPSAKMRMQVDEYDEDEPDRETRKSGRILNVILIILLLMLVGAIGMMAYYIKSLGI